MSLSLIPDSAPFSPEQRAWLNGFLSGWLGVNGEQPGGLYGNGVALGLLGDGDRGRTPTQAEEEFPWHDPGLPIVERLDLAAEKPLPRRLMAAMAQLDCGACGYQCQTYAEAIAAGEEKCLTLCAPGGGETAKAVKAILKEQGAAPAAAPTMNGASRPAPAGTRQNPAVARVKAIRNLNGPGSAKHTAHVEIDLADCGVAYKVGDALGVFPANCPELVEAIIDALGATGDELVESPAGRELPLREALRLDCDLATVDDALVELLQNGGDPAEAAAVRRAEESDSLCEYDVLDLLQLAPSRRPTPAELAEALGRLQPRLYSIASSPLAHPGEVHLTVGRVETELRGRRRKGVASTMFADRLQPGDEVRVFVHAAHGFTVPADPAAPMIMVGPGTGIAPFRAFLEERIATGAQGPNWLFFGDQRRATDFLYQEELEPLVAADRLRLDLAFSRDQDEKIYVQTRMLAAGEELFRWLEDGGCFFVCGDAKRMAVDVDRALCEIVARHGGLSPEAAAKYVNDLRRSGRYVRDVY